MHKHTVFNLLVVLALLAGTLSSPLGAPANRALAAPGDVTAESDGGFTIVESFDGAALPAGFVAYNGGGGGAGASLQPVDLPLLPASTGNKVAHIGYNIPTGYAGVTQDFTPFQDWSEYQYFTMMYYGNSSNKVVTLEIKTDGADPNSSNRFVWSFTEDFTGWKLLVVPFTSFVKRTDYNPGAALGDTLVLTKAWGYSVMLPTGATGEIMIDRVAVAGRTGIADFNGDGFPTGFVAFLDAWDGSGSSSTLTAGLEAAASPQLPGDANKVLAVTYNIAASGGWGGGPGYGGVTHNWTGTPQDWSNRQSFSLWFQGSNSGAEMRIEIKSMGPNEAGSDRFVWSFVDNATGWTLLNVPWTSFVKRIDFNPGAGLGDQIDLTQMWGYSILIPGGAAGSFKVDEVALYGKPVVMTPRAEFSAAAFDAAEGADATVTVTLSAPLAGPATVSYAAESQSARARRDFAPASGTLTFAAGETSKTFTVSTRQDTSVELTEQVKLTLSNPSASVILGAQKTAVVNITDDDTYVPVAGDPFIKMVDDFEYAAVPTGKDVYNNPVGFITWGSADNTALSLQPTTDGADPLAIPGEALPNQLLKASFNIAPGGWGGFTHAFENEALNAWVTQDWSKYDGVGLWLYGNNTGGELNFDIFDNKSTTGDSAERWTYIFKDNWSGWKFMPLWFEYFTRKGWQPDGAPNDGMNLNEVWAYAIGFPAGVNARVQYVDKVMLMTSHDMIDDYEGDIPSTVTDIYGTPVGHIAWSGNGAAIAISPVDVTGSSDPLAVPGYPLPDQLLKAVFNLGGGWGGFSYNIPSKDGTAWASEDWSTYKGVSFWMYGANTGKNFNLDLFDNKTTTGDSAERWRYSITDNFTGWKFFAVPFSSFVRRSDWQPGGAPDDGLNLTEAWGYAFDFPGGTGEQTVYFNNFEKYGSSLGATPQPLTVQFKEFSYQVTEGQGVTAEVKLTAAAAAQVTVDYATSGGTAREGYDYTAAAGTLTFAPGETVKSFTVATLQDTQYEGNETVNLVLSNASGAPLGATKSVTLTIVDDDPVVDGIIDNFEAIDQQYRYTPYGGATRDLVTVKTGDPLAVPGQDPVNTIFSVDTGADPNPNSLVVVPGVMRSYPMAEDWSAFNGLKFWYYGQNTGKDVTLVAKQGRAADPGPSGWQVVWADEFNDPAGTQPDPNKWAYDLGGGGWGNAEHEYYTDNPENASTDGNGNLVIKAIKIDNPAESGLTCWYGPCEYTSARILTKGRFDFAYGRAEARLKLPFGQGIWPAFWMLGADIDQVGWPNSGEIDIMENIGKEPNIVHGTVHGPGYSGGSGIGGPYQLANGAFADDFHVYGIEWEPNVIRWYMDGNLYLTITPDQVPAGKQWVFDHPFFLILNLAVGGYWPGYPDQTTTFPQTLMVDWVRVSQAPDTSTRFAYTFKDDFTGWKQIHVPFSSLHYVGAQPASVLDLPVFTGKDVWGYGFEFPVGSTQTYYVDDIMLVNLHTIWLSNLYRQITQP